MNKDLLEMKVERGADIFYNKEIDKFAQKKRRIELIYKYILMPHYLYIWLFSLVTYSGHHRRQGITNDVGTSSPVERCIESEAGIC